MALQYEPQSELRSLSTEPPEPPRRRRTLLRLVIYLVLLAIVAVVVWRVYQNKQQAAANTLRQAAMLQNRPVPVQVMPVEQKAMPIYLSALGTVTPYMSVTVKARVSGELLPVKFVEGQEVHQGETILQIDPKPYIAALDQAKGTEAHDEALLKNAQAEYARYKALYDAGVTSKETLDADAASLGQYEGAIASDKAAIENAQLQLNWCTIQSPLSGKIGLRLVDPGNLVAANTTNLVIINQLKPIAVYFTLPENQLPEVLKRLRSDKKMPVDAYDRGDVEKLAQGDLLTADNQIDTTTGTDRMKAVFANQNEALFPNQFVNIHLVLENRPRAIVVPSAAIQTGTLGPFVWTVEKNSNGSMVADIKPVKIALAEGQVTILDSGVEPGSSVVTDGADRLRPGQPVTVSRSQSQTILDEEAPNSGTESQAKPPLTESHQGAAAAAALNQKSGHPKQGKQ